MRELSLHILDALENALEAGATCVDLTIEEDLTTDRLTITVQDDGRGMDEEQLKRIYDPFFTTRTTRHVGLGVPLFKAAAERCNGELTVTSQPGKGTTLWAVFQHSHIDRAPLGDVAGTLLAFILSGACDLCYVHRVTGEAFEFHTADIRAELGDIPLTHSAVRNWLQEFIAEGETQLRRKSL
jgi:anti-sigma regulatory factor (Ser/Thr protein kinase)